MDTNNIVVKYANASHAQYAEHICQLIYESALQRGTGIAKRSPEYIAEKINGGKAVVALDGDKLIGFSYIVTAKSLPSFGSTKGNIRGIKINKQLKLADCKPYGNSPSREAVQTPAHTISKQGLGREARRGLHRLE